MDAADITALNDFNDEIVNKARRDAEKHTSPPRGICLYCEEKIADNAVFCDSWCRDQHEQQENIRRRTHK